jgi:hypothetical protein
MPNQENLLLNPLFRHGIAAMSTTVIVAVALLFVQSGRLRTMLLAVAVLDFLVTPQILKRAGKQAETDTGSTGL